MPGFGSATIRLLGIQSRWTATTGCASAAATSWSHASSQVACSAALQVAPHSRVTHQSGKSASSRRSSASSYGGSAVAGTLQLPGDEGGDRVAHQEVGAAQVAARLRSLQRLEVELAAEVVEEEEAVLRVRCEDARGVQAGGRDQAGDVDERPDVFLRRRRVHHDDAAAGLRDRRGSSGESWRRSTPAASSRRGRACSRADAGEPASKNASARAGSVQAMAGAGEEGGVTGRIGGLASARKGNASWIIDSTNRCRIGRRPRHRLRPAARARKPASRFAFARHSPSESSRSPRSPIQRSRAAAARRDVAGDAARRLHGRCARTAGAVAARSRALPDRRRPRAPQRRRRCRERPPASSCAAPTCCRRRRAATRRASCRSSCARARCAADPTSTPSAEGDVEFRRGGMVIRPTSSATTRPRTWRARTGHVVVSARRQRLQRPRTAAARSQRFEGFFRTPTYRFARTGAGGKASAIDFLDDQRAVATDATYTSCPVDGRRRRAGLDPQRATSCASTSRPTKASPTTPCCASTACRSWPRRC